jgi:sec-independent protein translocase protein TatA
VPSGDLVNFFFFALGRQRSFGLTWKIILIVAIVLLLFGSSRLPSLARAFGQSITEFKRGMKELEGPTDESSDRPR